MLPLFEEFLFILTLAAGLALIAIVGHSLSTRIFGTLFGLNAEDATLSAVLLFPLGEFLVIISTVAAAVLVGMEAKMISLLAFLLILITLVIFEPIYNFKHLHQKLFSIIPRLPEPKRTTVMKPYTPYTLKQAKSVAVNLFTILCLACVTILLYRDLPRLGVPIIYSRQATAFLVFAFFASLPFLKALRAFKRIYKSVNVSMN